MYKIKISKADVIDVIRSVLYSIILSMVFIMLFALIVKYTSLNEKAIAPVNIAIKIFSILFGCIFGIKNTKKGLIKGFIVGVLFSFLTYVIFSLVNKSFTVNSLTIYDILSCIVFGMICGILSVNVKGKHTD